MRSKSQLKLSVVLSYVNMGLGFIVSFVYTPVMLRLLGQAEYGVYQAASSVISYLGLLSFGFGSAYLRFYSRYKKNDDELGIKKLNGLFMIVYSAAAIISLVAGSVLCSAPKMVFGTKFSSDELQIAQKLMVLMVINLALTFIKTVFSMYINAHERFVFQSILNILSTIFNPLLTLPLLLMGYGSVSLTIVSTFLVFASLIACVVYAKKYNMTFSFRAPDKALLKEIAVFSMFIFISSVAGEINGTIDKLLLGRYIGPESVSVYEIGARFNTYLMTFSVYVSGVFIPRVNMLVANNASNFDLTKLMLKIGRIQFYIVSLALLGFILVGKYFIKIYAGDGYEKSYSIALMMMLASVVPYCQNIGLEIQKAKNLHKFRSVAYLLIAFANIAFSIPLIKTYGISGAALGSVLALVIGNVIIMNIYYKKGVGLDMGYFWKNMLRPVISALIAFIPCYVITLFVQINSIYRFAAAVIIFVIIYAASVWFIGSNNEEKSMVKAYLPKKKTRKES